MLAPEECIPIAIAIENDTQVDLLNRQDFVNQIVGVAESLAANNTNACYAINGEWGAGKTFILDAFEKRLRVLGEEGSILSKYLVFHYNCWQYDYYEEPLIAIVAALMDQIDEQVQLIPADKKDKLAAVLKTIGISMWGKACAVVKEKVGVDLEEISEIIKDCNKEAEKRITENHAYDSFFDFKKTLNKLSETIEFLAREQTVVLVVDELDRCLPEYTIKILERLHHVFDNIPNVQVVLAVDKDQLDNTIKGIYGSEVSVRRYLAKFIDFELKLEVGEVTAEVKKVFSQYFENFTYDVSEEKDVDEVCTTILKGVDIRTCKAVVEKSFLCHRLLNPEGEQCDAAVLCVEIFLTLLKELDLNVSYAKGNFNTHNLFTLVSAQGSHIFSSTTKVLTGLAVLSEKYKAAENGIAYITHDESGRRTYVDVRDLWGLLLGSYRTILGYHGDTWCGRFLKIVSARKTDIQEYVLEYWRFIKILN